MAELTIRSDRKTVGVLALVAAVALLIAAGVLSAVPMKTDAYDCGTFWASNDTWTYSSSASDPSSYYSVGTDPYDSALASINDMMSDLDTGAAAYDACEDRHSDRAVLIYTLGGIGLALLLITLGVAISGRRNTRKSQSEVLR